MKIQQLEVVPPPQSPDQTMQTMYDEVVETLQKNFADNWVDGLAIQTNQFKERFDAALTSVLGEQPNFLDEWDNKLNRPHMVGKIIAKILEQEPSK